MEVISQRPNCVVQFLMAVTVVLLYSVLSLLALISLPLRIIVQLTAKLCRRDLGPMLRGGSASFAVMDRLDRPKLNIVTVLILDGSLSLEELRSVVESRIINRKHPDGRSFYPELRQAFTNFLGYMFWKDVKRFSLHEHVRQYDYDDLPIGSIITEDDIQNVVASLNSKPWECGKSLWELLLIPDFKPATPTDNGAATALILRIHHAVTDGVAILKLLSRLDTRPEVQVSIPSRRWKQRSACEFLLHFFKVLLLGPWDVASGLLSSSDPPNPWHLDGKLSKKANYIFTKPFPVDMVKRIGNRHGVKFTSVVYTVILRSIARFLESKTEAVPSSMTAFIPAPLPASRPAGLTNYISSVYTRFPLTIESLRVHLKVIDGIVVRQSRSATPLSWHFLTELLGILPTYLQQLVFFLFSKHGPTLVISILPSPGKGNLFVKEVTCVDFMGAAPLGPGRTGVAISVVGCNGLLRICLLIDHRIYKTRESFQDFQYFVDQEFQALNDLQPENGDFSATDVV